MISRTFELGAVYKPDWDDRLIRVIAFDHNVVMYDVWSSYSGSWGLGKLIGKISYYRISTQFLLARASYVRTDEYTDTEFNTHRPDLPNSLAQFTTINWYDPTPANIQRLARTLATCDEVERAGKILSLLAAAEVYISPFGPKGSPKQATLVKAQDAKAFTTAELLWHAWQLQLPHLRENRLTNGLGLYRSGLQKQIPSYYIWGAKSRLDEVSNNGT